MPVPQSELPAPIIGESNFGQWQGRFPKWDFGGKGAGRDGRAD
jgi:hypothetical protein